MTKTGSPRSSAKYTKYLRTYTGRDLLKKHNPTETGTWRIRGEDPNCDFGGGHQPELGIVEGILKDGIEYAVELPRFWTWGAGGNIEKMEAPKKIDSGTIRRRDELSSKIKELEAQLERLKAEFEVL